MNSSSIVTIKLRRPRTRGAGECGAQASEAYKRGRIKKQNIMILVLEG